MNLAAVTEEPISRIAHSEMELEQEELLEEDTKTRTNSGQSKSIEALEMLLQKLLRSLGAIADNFDRFVTSFEDKNDLSLSKVLKNAGSSSWRHLRQGFRFGDVNLLWVCGIVFLLSTYTLICFRTSLQEQQNAVYSSEPQLNVSQNPPKRIQLPDGRNISYREQGVGADQARHSILVVHGFLSSRLAGIPGINTSLLEEYGVRLVAYDMPGYGESDPHAIVNDTCYSYNTSVSDMVSVADAVGLGQRFWILAYAGGGPHAWAAIHYIPERLAGVAMVAPAGNPYGGNLTSEESKSIWGVYSFRRKLLYYIAKRFPSVLTGFLRRTIINKISRLHRSSYISVKQKDQVLFENEEFNKIWEENIQESIKQQLTVPLAQELILLVNDWGFDLGDLTLKKPRVEGFLNKIRSFLSQEPIKLIGFQRPIHIFQGTEDVIVPPATNEFAKRILNHVYLHMLEGEGHFSWFYLCQECHIQLMQTLFGKPEGPLQTSVKPQEESICKEVSHNSTNNVHV